MRLSRSVIFFVLAFCFASHCLGAKDLANTNDPKDFLAYKDGIFILQNARIIDGSGASAVEGLDLRLQDGRIAAIGSSLPITGVDTVLDLDGATVMPGLIHMHDHIVYMSSPFRGYDFLMIDPHPFSVPKLYLSAGVTTVRTAGTDAPFLDRRLAGMIADGDAVGPKIFVAGNMLNGPDVAMMAGASTEEEGRDFVRTQLPLKLPGVKVYSSLEADALRGVVDEAHKHGMWVAGHLGYGVSCAEAARIGIDTIEHGFNSCLKDLPALARKSPPFRLEDHEEAIDALIDVLVEEGTVMVATPAGGTKANFSEEVRSMFAPFMRAGFDRVRVEEGNRSESGNPVLTLYMRNQIARINQKFVAAGGRLLIGADAMYLPLVPGYANHDIMIETAQYFSPMDVIRMATSDAADYLGIGDHAGRIKVGFDADLIIVPGRPDEDMTALRDLSLVFRLGRAYDPEKLKQAAVGRLGKD